MNVTIVAVFIPKRSKLMKNIALPGANQKLPEYI
jgi:hypothetical protein